MKRRTTVRPLAPRRRLVAALLGFVAVDLALALIVLGGVFDGSFAVAATQPRGAGALDALRTDRWNGFESSDAGPCASYPYEIRIDGEVVGCTHGPDPIPEEVRAAGPVDEAVLQARFEALQAEGGVAGGSGTVPCIGTGASGLRAVAIYAYEAGTISNYSTYAPMIRATAGLVDEVIDESAGQTGGSRHVRWHHDAGCNVIVQEVAVSTEAIYGGEFDPFSTMIEELYFGGRDRTDRRYVVWVDAPSGSTGICGIAMTGEDETAGAANIHNGIPEAGLGLFARIDRDCWNVPAPNNSVEAHEVLHTLGAVQPHAPYSSSTLDGGGNVLWFYGHCIDEYDTMCYDDGTPKSLQFICPTSQERLLDCRHDTYFHTNPPANSYLAKNWNPAMNAFLVRNDPIAGFIDVGEAFRADIAWLAESGITSGCTADLEKFCPTATVTRQQMASFLARALDLPSSPTDYFTDDETSIHETDINRVAHAGIASGCGGTRYCPTQVVTRAQMASFLARAFDLPSSSTDYFTDDESSIHEIDINRVAKAAITSGCTATTYCPASPVTRGQMAAFLHRALP